MPYYELQDLDHIRFSNLQKESKFCYISGIVTEYTDIASYFYTLWISHYIIKVVKNPISKHRRSLIFYHASANTFSLACTLYLLFTRSYGVSVWLHAWLIRARKI